MVEFFRTYQQFVEMSVANGGNMVHQVRRFIVFDKLNSTKKKEYINPYGKKVSVSIKKPVVYVKPLQAKPPKKLMQDIVVVQFLKQRDPVCPVDVYMVGGV